MSRTRLYKLLIAPLAVLAMGCTTGEERVKGLGHLYVSNRAGANLERFAEATTVAGDVLPEATVRGNLTRLSQPGFLTYHPQPKRMYVPNGGDNSILVFDNFPNDAENVPPTRIVSGPGTQLSRPVQVELDTTNDLLYVANAGNNSILVFANASTIQGGVAPSRILSGANTRIGAISAIHLDTAQDRLWVADPVAGALLVFNGASGLNGNVPPVRVIQGANTQLASPQFMLFQSRRLYVSCTNALVRFEDSDSINGNVAPTAVVSGLATALSRPQQLALRLPEEELYVMDAGASAVLVFAHPSSASGAPTPLRKLLGPRTGFSDAVGLILDLTETP